MKMQTLSEEEINRTADNLSKLEPGFLPYPIFIQVSRLMTLCTVVLLLFTDDQIPKVLLVQREKDDEFWPGTYHTPGGVLRATDKSIDEALERILQVELNNMKLTEKPKFFKFYFKPTKRGQELTLAYRANLTVTEYPGKLFALDEINEEMILDSEVEMIRDAFED